MYGAGVCPFSDLPLVGYVSRNGKSAYVMTARWPGSDFVITNVYPNVKRIFLPSTGKDYPFEYLEIDRMRVYGLPEGSPDPYVAVLGIEFINAPRKIEYYP